MLAQLTGFPAGLSIDVEFVDAFMRRRQGGFGRSARQSIERDRVDILSGVYQGATSGAPLALAVWNQDDSLPDKPPFTRPRPGHADLAGAQKYDVVDMRPILERASARETAARVAAGAVAANLLRELGVELLGHVVALGRVDVPAPRGWGDLPALQRRRDRSPFFSLSPAADKRLEQEVLAARGAGDTLGGVFEVRAFGVPPGLGSLDGFDSRLEARLGGALLSIPAIKAVEVGDGWSGARLRGSAVHDPVGPPGEAGPTRTSNRAGGVEGGMSNGEALVVRAAMKPIATLSRPLASWDYATGEASEAFYERSDVTAVPAAAVVGEAMTALVLADALLEKTGGDTLREVRGAIERHRRAVARRFGARGRPAAGHGARRKGSPAAGAKKPRKP